MAETSVTPAGAFTEFNVRQQGGKPHYIRLHDRVVKSLERELGAGRGEAFGILLGSVENGESCTLDVETFEAAVNPVGRERVVGYYRTDSAENFALDELDVSRYLQWFPETAALALLLKRSQTGPWNAMFYLGENGALTPERATVTFPFNLRELGAEDQPAPVTAAQEPPIAPARIEVTSRRPAWKTALAATAVMGLLIGLYAFRRSDPQPTAPVPKATEPVVAQPTVEAPAPAPKNAEIIATPVVAAPPKKAAALPEVRRPLQPPALQSSAPVIPPPQLEAQTPPLVVTPAPSVPPAPVEIAPAVKLPEPVEPYTPPHAIRQYAPVLKENVRRTIPGEAMIRLRVYVDSAGKVTGADPLNAINKLGDALADAAIISVKRWQFEPARRGSRNVSGQVELSFTFRK